MPMTCNQVASSSNGEEEDTLQRLLRAVAFLQAHSNKQTRLNAEAEQRQMEAEERHRKAEARKATVAKLGESTAPLPAPSTPAFWAQPFREEIDKTYSPEFP
ncbi:hypothetical protein CR513_36394, partial [Mucuna pruriens]